MFSKIFKRVLILVPILLILILMLFSYQFYFPLKGPAKSVIFEVPEGSTVKNIAGLLQEQRIIRSERIFLLGYKIFFPSKSLRAGEYSLDLPLSSRDVIKILSEGKVILYPLTIPEGLTRREIAQHLQLNYAVNEENFLEASSITELIVSFDTISNILEGYLFPETYNFPKNTSARTIVSAMISQFKNTFSSAWKKRAEDLGFTVREIVILASLVEEETSLPEERNLVSATFHNRLRIGMKLDCDPTIIYALKEDNAYTGRIRYRDLKLDSPYNTYIYAGLPPGPICNPGKASLEAALYPADEDYIYFVSKNDGSHKFSHTYKEHQRAVNLYQKRQ